MTQGENMLKHPRAALAAAGLALSGLVLTACSGSPAAQGDEVTINLWAGFTGADKQAMESMVQGFMDENPDVDVEFYSAPWNEMFTKFATAYGTDSGPDALVMHATDIPNFASRDMLTPLDDLTEDLDIHASSFAEPVWAGNTYDGTQWGIPLDYHPMAVFKNKAAFEAAGIDPNIQFDSKESFLEVARALTKDGTYGIGIGSDHAHTMRYWYGLLYQDGGAFLDEAGTEAQFADEAGVEALQFLHDLVNVEKVAPPNQSDIDRDFLSGNTAMVIEGPWFIPSTEEAGLDYTVAPFPTIFDTPATWAGSHTLTIPKNDDEQRQEAALNLVRYLSENSVEWAKSSGQIPASFDVVESAEYKALPNYAEYQAFIAQADAVHFEPLIPKTAELGADNQLSPVMAGVLEGVRGDAPAQTALDQAAERTDEILAD
jgi:multiple sugar transport system substrate-binding protein